MLTIAKMHGAANDFVVVTGPPPAPPTDASWVRKVADRRRGVGADGVLFLERTGDEDATLRMHFYNCDGGRAGLCLNGARCVALRAVQLGWASRSVKILTDHGSVRAEVERQGEDGGEVTLWIDPPPAPAGPILLPPGSVSGHGYPVHTGDPHLVVEVDGSQLESQEFEEMARPLRWWKGVFDEGSNVHLVTRNDDEWWIRSFERGVEGETLACGSGCVSAVVSLAGPDDGPVTLHVRSGDAIVIQRTEPQWQLRGPAVLSFTCEFEGPAGAGGPDA